MRKKVQFAQISLNILEHIPRKDPNPSHPLCSSQIAKTLSAYHLSTELQHYCIFINSPDAETTI